MIGVDFVVEAWTSESAVGGRLMYCSPIDSRTNLEMANTIYSSGGQTKGELQ